MPPALQPDDIEVVLVSPRNPLNIGAAARAMANFGLKHLTVVAPYDPSWRQARSAIEAEDLLLDAREVPTLAEAVVKCTLVAGTATSRYRRPDQTHCYLPELSPRVNQELGHKGRLALVFGSEKHGLTREELSLCNLLVEIPTHPQQPSMNLGQAVAVCLYELSRPPAMSLSITMSPAVTVSPAELSLALIDSINTQGDAQSAEILSADGLVGIPAGDLNRIADLILETMQAVRYSPASMRAANQQDIRLLLRRWHLTERDIRRALGLFRRILWKVRH